MQTEMLSKLLVVAWLSLSAVYARSQTQETLPELPVKTLEQVTITSQREIQLPPSYKALYRGMLSAIEAKPELGPNAILRLKLQAATASGDIKVSLVSQNIDQEVPLRDDLSFDLPMSEALLAEDPRFLVAGMRETPAVALMVQTPGTPEGATRLGDLRLACAFITGVRIESASGLNRKVLGLFGTRICRAHFDVDGDSQKVSLSFNGKSVTLESKGDRVEIPLRGRYPNDALIRSTPSQPKPATRSPDPVVSNDKSLAQ